MTDWKGGVTHRRLTIAACLLAFLPLYRSKCPCDDCIPICSDGDDDDCGGGSWDEEEVEKEQGCEEEVEGDTSVEEEKEEEQAPPQQQPRGVMGFLGSLINAAYSTPFKKPRLSPRTVTSPASSVISQQTENSSASYSTPSSSLGKGTVFVYSGSCLD